MLRQFSLSCALWGDRGLVDIVKLIGEVSGHGPELEELEQCADQPKSTHQTGTDLGAIECYGF